MFQTSVNLMPVKRAVGVEIWGGGKQVWMKFEKGGRQYRKGGGRWGLHKIGVLATFCQQ